MPCQVLLPFGLLVHSLKCDSEDLQKYVKDYHPLAALFLNCISDRMFTKEIKTNPTWKPSE